MMRFVSLMVLLVALPSLGGPKGAKGPKAQVNEPAAAPARAEAAPVTAPPAAPSARTDTAATPIPRFAKIAVGDCGCALYAPKGMVFEDPELSQDGSKVWSSESPSGAFHFGAVIVRFPEPHDADADASEALLISYLDFLKQQFDVTASAGVGRGHRLESHPAARGVIDYWQSGDGERWAVKGWIDRERLAVLMVRGPEDYPYLNASEMYLNGFRFEP